MIQQFLPVHLLWCESDNASTKALTTSYVVTEGPAALDVTPFNVVCLYPVLTGTALTSLDLLVELSADGTNWNPVPSKAVSPTLVSGTVAEIVLTIDASGRCPMIDIDVGAAKSMRVSAKRTGGDATSSLLLNALCGSLR